MTISPTTPTPAIAEGEPPRLEACPWCKKPATFHRSQLPGDEYPWCAGCWSDGCTMDDLSTPYFQTCEEAAACWNAGARRPSPEGRREVRDAALYEAAAVAFSLKRPDDSLACTIGTQILALQATPARTGEGPLTREEVEKAHDLFWQDHPLADAAEAETAALGITDDHGDFSQAVLWLRAWSQVRGSLRTGEREAALEEAARTERAHICRWLREQASLQPPGYTNEMALMDRCIADAIEVGAHMPPESQSATGVGRLLPHLPLSRSCPRQVLGLGMLNHLLESACKKLPGHPAPSAEDVRAYVMAHVDVPGETSSGRCMACVVLKRDGDHLSEATPPPATPGTKERSEER